MNEVGSIGYVCTIPLLFEKFIPSYTTLVHYNATHNIPCAYLRATHGDQAFGRNELAQKFVGDWLLMLDTDMSFAPDIFKVMVDIANVHNIDILSGVYCKKEPPYSPVAFKYIDEKFYPLDLATMSEIPPLLPIEAAGGGCLLTNRSVFDRIKNELNEEPFTVSSPYPEDLSFFKRVLKLGIQPYLATDIQCGHFMLKELTFQDYLEYNKEKKDG